MSRTALAENVLFRYGVQPSPVLYIRKQENAAIHVCTEYPTTRAEEENRNMVLE